jgi:para-nitrobenzyl esterase
LRFQPPVRAPGWDGVREAVDFGAAPPQLAPAPGAPSVWKPADGLDCLSVNVWTPDLGGSGLPVMVWFYGGAFKHGWSGSADFDGSTLAASGVVLVTFNYRFGFEGFGHLPGVPDNRGLLDQIAALEWVQENVAAFGGDPAKVTVFGQSAGAACIAALMASSRVRGLFGQAIVQSMPAAFVPLPEASRVTEVLASTAGVSADWDGFSSLAPEKILTIQDTPLRGPAGGGSAFGPVIDGDLVADWPWTGMRGDVGLVCGFTHEEARLYTVGRTDADLAAAAASVDVIRPYRETYPQASDAELFTMILSDRIFRMPTTSMAEAHAEAGGRTWLYDLTWQSPLLGSAHILDVPLIFGNGSTPLARRFLGSPPPAEFYVLSELIRAAWVSFATSGDPGWPRFEPAARTTRLWDLPPSDVPYPLEGSRDLWRK